MSFNRSKYEYLFPSKVFRCACLGAIIEKCCDNGNYSLTEIADEISNHNFIGKDGNKIFSVKCGEQNRDCGFACENLLVYYCLQKRSFHALISLHQQIQPSLITMVGRKHTVLVVSNTI